MKHISSVEHYSGEVSRVVFADGKSVGVNSWEVEGVSRKADGYTNWQYSLAPQPSTLPVPVQDDPTWLTRAEDAERGCAECASFRSPCSHIRYWS